MDQLDQLRTLLSRLASHFRSQRLDADLDEELRAHLDLAIEEHMRRGLTRGQARTAALRSFGGVTQTKETYRSQRGLPLLEAAAMDLRYGLRQLRKSPAFTATAVLTLAVGIGATTAVFSVVQSVLLSTLPFPDSGRLISVHEFITEDPHDFRVTAPDVLIFQRESKAFTGTGGYISSGYDITGAGAPFHAAAERMTASLFPVLGINPILGRTFTQQEDENAAPVTVISSALWRERFQADPNILGKEIDLDRRPYTIIGVMPQTFEFPLEAGRLSHHDLWVPMSLTTVEKNSEGENYDYGLVARLKPGVNAAQAQVDIDRVMAIIQPGYTRVANLHVHGYFRTLKDETVRNARPLLNMLVGAVALILLIACVNLANLLLVRAAGRTHEFGLRLALGAARRIVMRQLLTESLLLSAIGGAAGTLFAMALVRAAAVYLPGSLPRLNDIAIRWPMFLSAFTVVALTGLLCGIAPALAGMRTDILESLRAGSAASGQGRSDQRLQNTLVAVEIALAMVLLVASGLLLRSPASRLGMSSPLPFRFPAPTTRRSKKSAPFTRNSNAGSRLCPAFPQSDSPPIFQSSARNPDASSPPKATCARPARAGSLHRTISCRAVTSKPSAFPSSVAATSTPAISRTAHPWSPSSANPLRNITSTAKIPLVCTSRSAIDMTAPCPLSTSSASSETSSRPRSTSPPSTKCTSPWRRPQPASVPWPK
jgi:hypothetical protein